MNGEINASSAARNGRIPTALAVVAWMFLLAGLGAVYNVVENLRAGRLFIDCGIFGIPAFFGLRSFSRGWRTYALVMIWIGLAVTPVLFLAGLSQKTLSDVKCYGLSFAEITPIGLVLVSATLFLVLLWEYRVLTRPDIRELFFPSSPGIGHRDELAAQ
jgi:hypothetical protein